MATHKRRFRTCLLALCMIFSSLQVTYAQESIERFYLMPNAEESPPNDYPPTLFFGSAVAMQGDTALVSLPNFQTDPRVAVFTRTALGEWQRTGSLAGEIGRALALSGDNALVYSGAGISAYHRYGLQWRKVQTITTAGALDNLVMHGRTAAYIDRTLEAPLTIQMLRLDQRNHWIPGERLVTSDAADGGQYHWASLALANDTLVLGVAADSESRGAAYVFRRAGSHWREHQKLNLANGTPGDVFGSAVAVHRDRIVVGAPGADRVAEFEPYGSGAVYVFDRHGRYWTASQKLRPAVTAGEFPGFFQYGSYVGLSDNVLAVAAPAWQKYDSSFSFLYRPASIGTYTLELSDDLGGFYVSDLDVSGHTVMLGVPSELTYLTGIVLGYTVQSR